MSEMREPSYFSWLTTEDQIFPPYDYFNFANTFHQKDQQRVNRWYSNTMKKALTNTEGDRKIEICLAINQFNKRNDSRTAFREEYKNYWLNREKPDSQKRIEILQRRASEVAKEAACSAFERIIVKVASNSTSDNGGTINGDGGNTGMP